MNFGNRRSVFFHIEKAYFRRLVVRAIEDALVLLLMGAAIWSLCFVVGGALNLLGVG